MCRIFERLATALSVTRQMADEASVEDRAEALNEVKPHVSLAAATEAVDEIDQLITASREACAGLASCS